MTKQSPEFMDMQFEIETLKAELASTIDDKNSAYNERNCLVALLAHIFPAGIRKTDIPGWDAQWHNCVFIDTPAGQMSWHYHDSEAPAFADLPAYDKPWDGHTTADKYERMGKLAQLDIMIFVTSKEKSNEVSTP